MESLSVSFFRSNVIPFPFLPISSLLIWRQHVVSVRFLYSMSCTTVCPFFPFFFLSLLGLRMRGHSLVFFHNVAALLVRFCAFGDLYSMEICRLGSDCCYLSMNGVFSFFHDASSSAIALYFFSLH